MYQRCRVQAVARNYIEGICAEMVTGQPTGRWFTFSSFISAKPGRLLDILGQRALAAHGILAFFQWSMTSEVCRPALAR